MRLIVTPTSVLKIASLPSRATSALQHLRSGLQFDCVTTVARVGSETPRCILTVTSFVRSCHPCLSRSAFRLAVGLLDACWEADRVCIMPRRQAFASVGSAPVRRHDRRCLLRMRAQPSQSLVGDDLHAPLLPLWALRIDTAVERLPTCMRVPSLAPGVLAKPSFFLTGAPRKSRVQSPLDLPAPVPPSVSSHKPSQSDERRPSKFQSRAGLARPAPSIIQGPPDVFSGTSPHPRARDHLRTEPSSLLRARCPAERPPCVCLGVHMTKVHARQGTLALPASLLPNCRPSPIGVPDQSFSRRSRLSLSLSATAAHCACVCFVSKDRPC